MGLPSYDVSKSPPVWLVSLRERSRMALVSFTCVYCDGVRRSGSSEIYRNVFLLVRVPVFTRTSKVFLCWWCHGGRLRTEAGAVRLTGVYVTLFLCWGDKRTFSSYDHTHTHTHNVPCAKPDGKRTHDEAYHQTWTSLCNLWYRDWCSPPGPQWALQTVSYRRLYINVWTWHLYNLRMIYIERSPI